MLVASIATISTLSLSNTVRRIDRLMWWVTVWICDFPICSSQKEVYHYSFNLVSGAIYSLVRWCQNAFCCTDSQCLWGKCMRERTYTTLHLTTSLCAHSVANCVSSVGWMGMRYVCVMYWRIRPLRSVSARTWCATNSSAQTQFIRVMHRSKCSSLSSSVLFCIVVLCVFIHCEP